MVELPINQIVQGDAREVLKNWPAESVDMCVCSPPYYGLRSNPCEPIVWGWEGQADCRHEWGEKQPFCGQQAGNKVPTGFSQKGRPDEIIYQLARVKPHSGQFCQKCGVWLGQLGLEPSPELYVQHLVGIFREVRRVLKPQGTLWLNLGDSYAGKLQGNLKQKDLIGIPWMVAFALRADGWYLRQDIIWLKPNPMPSSVRDRCTTAHEYIFMLAKNKKYYYDNEAIKEPCVDQESLTGRRFRGRKAILDSGILPGGPSGIYNTSKIPEVKVYLKRNKRDVWVVTVKSGAKGHFSCVSADTECLTLSGWKRYNELVTGESIGTFSLSSKKLQFERLNHIHTYKYKGCLIETLNPNSNFIYTQEHKAVCRKWQAKRQEWSDFYFKEIQNINSADRFPVCAEWEKGSYGFSYEPSLDMCEILGWIAAEGYYAKYSIKVYQSLTRNRKKVQRIERLFRKEKLDYTKRIVRRQRETGIYEMACFTISWINAKRIFNLLPNKRPSWQMLGWTKKALKRFIKGFVAGDGSIHPNGTYVVMQKNEETVDILQALIFKTGSSVKKSLQKGRNIFHLYVKNRKTTSARKTASKKLNVKSISYQGIVWCPETPSGTFIARRKGNIIITGNSYPPDLIEPCILAGSPVEGIVLDSFMGSGTTALVAEKFGRNWVGIDASEKFVALANKRLEEFRGLYENTCGV